MFASFGSRSKIRRRRSRRLSRGRVGRRSRLRINNLMPLLKIAGLVVLGLGLIAVIIFVIIPLFGGEADKPIVEVSETPTVKATPIANDNMFENVEELAIAEKSINDPYIYGNEVIYTTGDKDEIAPEINTIAIYNTETQDITYVPGIEKQHNSLFEPKINDNFIVYLDCKSEYGGAVCGYDRSSGTQFVMREYLYGKPRVTLAGNYALWMQQTASDWDKLYLYDLTTKMCTTREIFVGTPFSVSAPFLSEDYIIYVQPEGENKVLKNSSSSTKAELCIIPLVENGDMQSIYHCPGTYVYFPMISGDDIVYIDTNRDENSRLLHIKKDGDTFTEPEEIAQGILNYYIGDGFVAYTKDDAIYIYYFKDGSSARISSETTRAILASANGKDIVWYDITDGFNDVPDIVMHLNVP